MKKRLKIFVCALLLAFAFTSCGSTADDTIGGRTEAEYQTEISSMMTQLAALDEEAIDYNISYISSYDDGATLVALLEDYKDCYDPGNVFLGLGEFSVEKSGKTITATQVADYSVRDLKMTFVYSTIDTSTPTAMNIEPVYTLGETMQKAALNTVMGILIVFAMLIVMSGVIKLFEIIPKLEKRAKEKEENEIPAASPVVTNAVPQAKGTDDLELVAVITAAIAASTGASTDSFVVRSIKRRY